MIKAPCICQRQSFFTPFIEFKNEVVFRDFEGAVIGKCNRCRILKTVIPPKKIFNPQISRVDIYEEKRDLFIPLFQSIIKRIKQFKKEGKILDVGCSSGLLFELLQKEGFNVFGIEPNKKAFQAAYKKFKKRVYYGTLQQYLHHCCNDANKQINKFDLIIYNHVLEHIADINKEIKMIKKLLKSKGLLILGTPNTSNVIFFLRKKYWESLMPQEHIWHFSKNYLVNYLKKHRFKILDISFSDDKRQNYPLIKRIYFYWLSFLNKLFNTGEAMLVIAQK